MLTAALISLVPALPGLSLPPVPELAPAPVDPIPVSAAAAVVDAGAADSWYPPAKGELVIEIPDGENTQGAGPSMFEVVQSYAALTGQHLVATDETTQLLRGQTTGLRSSIRVAPERVQQVFESLLIEQDFALRIVHDAEPRIFSLASLKTQARNTIRSGARFVPETDLAAMRRHPATLVSTTVVLEHTDVRQLSNSMRTMITDANTQQMLPAGNTNAMVVVGFGSQVAGLISALHQIDDAARQNPPAQPAPARGEAK